MSLSYHVSLTLYLPCCLFLLVELPEIRRSDNSIDKDKPLPTSLQCDFIPDDVLLAITHPPPGYDKLGPLTRYRNINTTTVSIVLFMFIT